MCEALGSDPVESEIPIEFEDLMLDVQESLSIYQAMQDMWDTMSGTYMGKNFTGIKDILDLSGVEDHKTTFTLLKKIDSIRADIIASKKPKKPAE
jgi:hypothetical protein